MPSPPLKFERKYKIRKFLFLIFDFLKYYRLNNRINTPKVRLIDENGEHLGILDVSEALRLSQERNLDLVEINPKTNPPIAKMMSFAQFKYKLKKQEKKQKHPASDVIKGIRLSPTISQHDLEVRLAQAKKFLAERKKIKIEMQLKGREKAHFDLALNVFQKFIQSLENAAVEQPPKRLGAKIIAIVKPL
ncbi:MAG: Translation initiation factor IF-3 [Parcubacteria group bacterium ADurb.Bin159]|jgi:translation initiation factor IF-3|nr:MAG: Translation initiation factor IF-3 [Parcubacteria group bacterium ADurb.Bin159]